MQIKTIRPFLFMLGWLSLLPLNVNAQVTVVSNANIYLGIPLAEKVEAFAHEDGLVVAYGKQDDLTAAYPDATHLDLSGATVVPGFIDAHAHLLGLGESLMRVDLMGTDNKGEVLQRMKDFAADLSDQQWLLGRGWDQNDWPVKELPSVADLDSAFPSRPVWVRRIDGHAGWGNSAALAFASEDLTGDWQPDGGEIKRNQQGEATGIFIDNAMQLIESKIPAPSDQQMSDALSLAMNKTASVGLTSIHDAGTSKRVWDLLRTAKSANELKVRVYAMADGDSDMLAYLCKGGAIIDPYAMLSARSVKLYSDGALGSRGAALLTPYSDSPDQLGLLLAPEKTLAAYTQKAAACGLQVNIHAIGDRGNRVSLDAFKSAANVKNPGRHRIEHAQIIESSDFIRFKQLGVIASVQPTHATSDMYWAEDRVGSKRIKGAYAWQTMSHLGIPLALGSDFPVEKADPLLGFYAAISRQDAKGWPKDGWYPNNGLLVKKPFTDSPLAQPTRLFRKTSLDH